MASIKNCGEEKYATGRGLKNPIIWYGDLGNLKVQNRGVLLPQFVMG